MGRAVKLHLRQRPGSAACDHRTDDRERREAPREQHEGQGAARECKTLHHEGYRDDGLRYARFASREVHYFFHGRRF